MSRLKTLFTSPEARPRLIVWLGVLAIAALVFTAVSTIGTSTNWFCTQPCHMVHDDNTLAFDAGSHVMIPCVSCHEPVNGSPVEFILMKLEVAPDLIPTVMGTFHLPMNENSAISFEMTDEYCTQCHSLDTRQVTPTRGILIDHDAHTAEGITCTSCHNRVAHPEEDITFVLEGSTYHENWMVMDACFRCHGLEADAEAPGACEACHPATFDLVPASHDAEGWYEQFGESGGHAAAYAEETSRVIEAEAWAEGFEEIEHLATWDMGYEQTVNTCYTCHKKAYCTDCHGVEMPHPDGFVEDHGELGREKPESCATCHAESEAQAQAADFCNACHHPQGDPGSPWLSQHNGVVRDEGATGCFECHDPTYCAACHVRGG
jgi:nitrate/TMAO reductase-like tetraheme cytochrome c subunit